MLISHLWTLPVRVLQGSGKNLLPHTVGVPSTVVAAGVRLLLQLEAGVFGGRSHAPLQPL